MLLYRVSFLCVLFFFENNLAYGIVYVPNFNPILPFHVYLFLSYTSASLL